MNSNLFVISGPSGVGKDTVMALIFDQIPNLNKWVTCTTRQARDGEVEGVNYFYKTKDEFQSMIDNDELVEWNKFADSYYGTPKKYVEDKLKEGKNVIAAIDINGAMAVKKVFPYAKLIFLEPPRLEDLKDRLAKRGSETSEDIEKRLAIAKSEIARKNEFDTSIVNDDIQTAASKIINFINSNID